MGAGGRTGDLRIDHSLPEGIAIGVPLAEEEDIGEGQMFGVAVFSSLPQPIGAVVAYAVPQLALEVGYGFAVGAMLYLVVQDVILEGLEAGEDLENATADPGTGAVLGVLGFVPLVVFL